MKRLVAFAVLAALLSLAPAAHAAVAGIDFSTSYAYSGQSSAVIAPQSNSFTISGDIWAAFAFASPYTVRADSVLTFGYSSDSLPEIGAVGFDADNVFQYDYDSGNAVKISGTQGNNWPQAIYDPQYVAGSGVVQYNISLAEFLRVGDVFNYIVFINDDDNNAPVNTISGSSTFYNVAVTDGASPTPLPAAGILLASGLLGLVGLRKRVAA